MLSEVLVGVYVRPHARSRGTVEPFLSKTKNTILKKLNADLAFAREKERGRESLKGPKKKTMLGLRLCCLKRMGSGKGPPSARQGTCTEDLA